MRTLAVCLVCAVLLGACGLGPPDRVVLGLVVPLSGDRAYLGLEVENGVRMAVEDLNDDGGLLGRRVELAVRDDSDLVDLPAQLAELAERQRVTAVIGPEAPAVLLGPRNPLSRRDVPALLATGFTGDLAEAGSTVFRTVPSAHDQAVRLGRWLTEERRIDDVAVLVADPVEGQLAADALREGLGQAGAAVVAEVLADPDAPDLRPAVARLQRRAGTAGAVILWGPPAAAARATRAVRDLGWDVQIAVPSSAFVGEYRTLAERASEGVVLPFPFREDWFGPEMERWLVRWYRDHGLEALPDLDTLVLDLPVAGLAAYDAVMLVAEAVEEAGSREPAEVADALTAVTYEGLLRTYRFGPDDREAWELEDLHVARVHNFAVVYDVDPRLDQDRQRRFYQYQVELSYLPDAVLQGPAGEVIRDALEAQRRRAPDYVPPSPPPGPVARPEAG
ncbi:MAG: ABC transporter substrate-binding protein [Actinobacteria bacterium]|nr:ABC transporter substrate-binding protein [Actinomycetota bacterium]